MFEFLRKFIKKWFINCLLVTVLAQYYLGFESRSGLSGIFIAGLLLAIVQMFFHPLLKMLWLPINIITFGMFSWFLQVIHLLIVDSVMKNVNFIEFNYDKFVFLGFNFAAGRANILVSIIVGGLIYVFIKKLIEFVVK